MSDQEVWSPVRLKAADIGITVVWGMTDRASFIASQLNAKQICSLNDIDANVDTLVVVGGGIRLDTAKFWRLDQRPALRLIAVPSLWGSGAEASPVVVLNHDGNKDIYKDEGYLPDIRCVFPELMVSIPEQMAYHACGDAWSHVLEGFLSPLADHSLRSELAGLIDVMLELPLGKDLRWFDVSAKASAGQARSSVGLVHGIAHTLEWPMKDSESSPTWGHARLCSTFLFPVMRFNREATDVVDKLTSQYGIDVEHLLERIQYLFNTDDYQVALPYVEKNWSKILRDPCTRTNSVLVRPGSLGYFLEKGFM